MSDKDNLPVKYRNSGKPKVKEQATQWVEEIEVFDGFNFEFGLIWWILAGLLVGAALFLFVEFVLPDSNLVWGILLVLWTGWCSLLIWHHWEERFSGGAVTYILQIICSGSVAAGTVVMLGVAVAVVAGIDLPLTAVWVYSGLYLLYFLSDYLADSVETRTEERVVSDNEGGQL
jgi:hypothetical protein